MLKNRTILSFYQCASCRTLAIELVRQTANSTYLSKQSGHKEQPWPSGIRAAGLIWNTLSAKSWLTLITNVRLLYHTSAVILLWCSNFRFNNYSIHDNAWHCIQYQYRWWWCSRVKCRPITFGAAHPSLRWAATCHLRTLLPGPEGVRSWQVLLYKHMDVGWIRPGMDGVNQKGTWCVHCGGGGSSCTVKVELCAPAQNKTPWSIKTNGNTDLAVPAHYVEGIGWTKGPIDAVCSPHYCVHKVCGYHRAGTQPRDRTNQPNLT